MSSGPTNRQILVHEVGLSITWEILLNITVIMAILKHSWSAAFLHMAIGFCMLGLTYFFILWFLIPFGFIQSQKEELVYYLHAIIGCAMLGFILMLVSSGMFTKYGKDSKYNKSLKNFIKIFHKSFAYFIIVLFKINILFNWYGTDLTVFSVLTAWDVIFLIIWAYLKFFNNDILQSTVLDMRVKVGTKISIQQAGSLKQIQVLKYPYVIYNGYLYDATRVIKHHPGGQKVINSIVGREVDRFLYGMYSSELVPEVLPHSHSTGALALLREPLVKIVTPCPYKGFHDSLVGVQVQFMNQVSKKNKIFVIGLVPLKGEFQFCGYSDMRQLGQYYSLTMGESITRLYTTVNFLNRHNILLLNQLLPGLHYDIQEGKTWKSKRESKSELRQIKNNKEVKLIDDGQIDTKKYLPIMLKIYDQGKFTSKLANLDLNTAKLQLSQPKGFGLQLEITKPGRIVIVAGGTGLFPFSDFIDLYFKAIYLQENKTHQTQILQNDPILKTKPFQKYIFVLMAAINDPEDLHPITYHQLAYLSRHHSKFKVVLRVSKDEQVLKQMDSKIQFTRDYFTNRVVTESKVADFSRVWICGPPKMATDTAQNLLKNGFSRESFLLL